jgi:hypothetical protein
MKVPQKMVGLHNDCLSHHLKCTVNIKQMAEY